MAIEKVKQSKGRPKKSTSYIQRSVRVILPDMIRVKEWKDLAKKSNLSMSKFIMKHVENSLDFTGEDENTSRKALLKQNQTLQHELQLLKQDLELKSRAYEALDSELTTMRNRPWMTPMEEGMRVIARNLTALFETRKRINYNELLPLLGVKPTDTVLVQGINRQIDTMIYFGLVESDFRGWRWLY